MTVFTRDVWAALIRNEKYLNRMEMAYAKRLIKWSSAGGRPFKHIAYLEHILSLNLTKQKTEVNFLVSVFECVGLKLSPFELRYFQNERSKAPSQRKKIAQKKALAEDSEIQV